MKKVIIESPYMGRTKYRIFKWLFNWLLLRRNKKYLNRCIADAISRGESPYASHKMLTDSLNDNIPEERKKGIEAGFVYLNGADIQAFYVDYGWSEGMRKAKDYNSKTYRGSPAIQVRVIGKNPTWWEKQFNHKYSCQYEGDDKMMCKQNCRTCDYWR